MSRTAGIERAWWGAATLIAIMGLFQPHCLSAADQMLPGTRFSVRPSRFVRFHVDIANSSGFSLPVPGSSDDPTLGGATLMFFDTVARADGFLSYTLDKNGWIGLGKQSGSKGYKFVGESVPNAPCKRVLINKNAIRAYCRKGVTLGTPFQANAGVILSFPASSPDLRYCVEFGGTQNDNNGRFASWKLAPAQPVCPTIRSGTFFTRLELMPSIVRFNAEGQSVQLKVLGRYADGTPRDVTADAGTTFESSDVGIATVDATGMVTAIAVGQAEVRAHYGGLLAVASVLIGLDTDGDGFLDGEEDEFQSSPSDPNSIPSVVTDPYQHTAFAAVTVVNNGAPQLATFPRSASAALTVLNTIDPTETLPNAGFPPQRQVVAPMLSVENQAP